MKEKYFQDLYEQIEVPEGDVQQSIQAGLQNAKLRGRKKNHLFRKVPVAAFLLITMVTILNLSFPTFAEKLPFIGSVYELFKNENRESVFEQYGNHSTNVGEARDSNGITVTVTDTVYDGENITIVYLIESEKELGERPILEGDLIVEEFGDKYKDNIYPENFIVEKLNEHQYVALYIYQLIEGPKPEKLHVMWKGDTITDLNNVYHSYPGNWEFEFTLPSLSLESHKPINKGIKSTEEEGIKISLIKMVQTPISSTFYLSENVDIRKIVSEEEKWRGVLVEYIVTDNLGNEYDAIHFRDTGHSIDFTQDHRSYPRITTTIFHDDATSITITPFINTFRMVNSDGVLEHTKQPYSLQPIVVPLDR